MAYTDPRGKPCSVPQWSRTYCDMARLGSIAQESSAKRTARPAQARSILIWRPSREVLKILDHHPVPWRNGLFLLLKTYRFMCTNSLPAGGTAEVNTCSETGVDSQRETAPR